MVEKRQSGRARAKKKRPTMSAAPTVLHFDELGPNGRKVAELVADLRTRPTWNASGEALAQLALTLAGTLDGGAGLAVAAVARELRAALTDLSSFQEVPRDSDDDESWIAGLPAAVPHPEGSAGADTRPAGRRGRSSAGKAADAVAEPRRGRGPRAGA